MNNDIGQTANKLSTTNRQLQRFDRQHKQIQAVAFDMDGLMLNTEDLYLIVSQTLMSRRGKEYRESVRSQMIGLPAEHAFGVLIREEGLTDSWRELQRETEEIFTTILDGQLKAMPGLIELLDYLDEHNIRRCVATSSTQSFATRALEIVGVLDRIDFILTADDVERGKPHPDIYIASAKRLSVDVANMLVLEDSPKGTAAGVAAGAYVVSVPNEHTRDGTFEGCRWQANSLLDSRIYEVLS